MYWCISICFRVGIQLPTVEVRFEQLRVEADCHVGIRALPTLLNTSRNIFESALGLCGIRMTMRTKYTILKDVSGIIKPSRYCKYQKQLKNYYAHLINQYETSILLQDDITVRSSFIWEDNPFACTGRKVRSNFKG